MPWSESFYEWLAYSAFLSLAVLTLGSGAVLLCRQPARRLRIIELSLAGCLLAPLLGMIPGYPRLGIVWRCAELPQREAISTPPAASPAVGPADSPTVAPVVSQPDVVLQLDSDLLPQTIAEPAQTPVRAWNVGSWLIGLYLLGVAIGVAWWLLGMAALARVIWTARRRAAALPANFGGNRRPTRRSGATFGQSAGETAVRFCLLVAAEEGDRSMFSGGI